MSTLLFGDSFVVLMASVKSLLGVILVVVTLVLFSLGFSNGAGGGRTGLFDLVHLVCFGDRADYYVMWFCLASAGFGYREGWVCFGVGLVFSSRLNWVTGWWGC